MLAKTPFARARRGAKCLTGWVKDEVLIKMVSPSEMKAWNERYQARVDIASSAPTSAPDADTSIDLRSTLTIRSKPAKTATRGSRRSSEKGHAEASSDDDDADDDNDNDIGDDGDDDGDSDGDDVDDNDDSSSCSSSDSSSDGDDAEMHAVTETASNGEADATETSENDDSDTVEAGGSC